MVTDFILAYTKLLVENPDDISIEISEGDEKLDEIILTTNSEDVGKLIGKNGKMINAIKTVISGCKSKGGKNYRLNVKALDT